MRKCLYTNIYHFLILAEDEKMSVPNVPFQILADDKKKPLSKMYRFLIHVLAEDATMSLSQMYRFLILAKDKMPLPKMYHFLILPKDEKMPPNIPFPTTCRR